MMNINLDIIMSLGAFLFLLFASHYFAGAYQRIKLPLITGFLFTGIICGPQITGLISAEMIGRIDFVNEISLAFIAFAIGSELYLNEIRSRISSISTNSTMLIVITFLLGVISLYLLFPFFPDALTYGEGDKIAIALLAATVFLASSPSTILAVVNEVRAKGPFTRSAVTITMIKDVIVIILFTLCFSISLTLVANEAFNISKILLILLELFLTFLIGWGTGKWLNSILSLHTRESIKTLLIVLSGYIIIQGTHLLLNFSQNQFTFQIYLEPLLICTIAGFYVINYTKNRPEFDKIISQTIPFVFIAFFTLTGISMDISLLISVWPLALGIFFIRIITLFLGSTAGTLLAGDPPEFRLVNWMPYVTQGAIALGITSEIASEFINWGLEFQTIITGAIILNLLFGPWLFKKALLMVKEGSPPTNKKEFTGPRTAMIFGLEDQSIALTKQLLKNGWRVKIITTDINREITRGDLDVIQVNNFAISTLQKAGLPAAASYVLMLQDNDNYKIAKWIKDQHADAVIIVRLRDHTNVSDFSNLDVHPVYPPTAMINLLVHFVQSPMATSLLVSEDINEDIADLEVHNPDLHGMSLRNLKIPVDVIILSVRRRGQMIISHGYTRLRLGDIVTVAGKNKDLKKIRLMFEV